MEYTIKKLARLSGTTPRTLRYYDEIGLLKPAIINSSGYRIYGEKELNILQQILFYRELGVSLQEIKRIITSPTFDRISALKEHRKNLIHERERLDLLISNVDKTIKEAEGRIKMQDEEKFIGFKKEMITENERKYGKEAREKYGDETVEKSNKKLMDMRKEEYEELNKLSEEIINLLSEAMETGDPSSPVAQKLAELHKKWLMFFWSEYSKEAHAGLAKMYVDDERFASYYDKQVKPGSVKFLRDAILKYTGYDKK